MRTQLAKEWAAVALALAGMVVMGEARAQTAYASPEAAADALIAAVAAHEPARVQEVLGRNWKRFVPTDVIDSEDVQRFLDAAARSKQVLREGEGRAVLGVGEQGWTLPIPMVQGKKGWTFDMKAGGEEMTTRRVGRNELAVIAAALAYYDAQREYAAEDRNGDGVGEYAQRFFSTPGQKDGLYWPVAAGEPESPLGPYFGSGAVPGKGYHGYRFRILTAQGPHAQGGAYDYLIGGRLTGGFALVAWPAKHDDTGVMTFIVNHDGVVYQKDLGWKTGSSARTMKLFDPDETWTPVGQVDLVDVLEIAR